MKTSFIFISLILVSVATETAVSSADINAQDLVVFQAIIEAQRQRERLYGNMHGVWEISNAKSSGEISKANVEYWARDGAYYRVDWLPVSSAGDSKKGTRVIVRPEGYARLLIDSSEDVGTVIQFDESEDFFWRITGGNFYGQGNRALDEPVWKILDAWIDGTSAYEKVELMESIDGNIIINIHDSKFQERGIARDVTTITLAPDSYVCLSAIRKFNYKDGGEGTNTIEYHYDSDQPEIPTDFVYVAIPHSDKEGEKNTEVQARKEISLDPAEMSVFEIDTSIFNRRVIGWSWSRRIVVLLIGVVLMGVYFVWRRKTSA